MAKFSVKAPPTFKAKVGIPLHGGGTAEMEFTFKHRTEQEYDEFQKSSFEMFDHTKDRQAANDVMVEAIRKEGESLEAATEEDRVRLLKEAEELRARGRKMQDEYRAKRRESDIKYLLSVATGWDAEEEFNAESIALLFANYIGAPAAIGNAYFHELKQERLKN